MVLIGVDTGGTFTDFVIWDGGSLKSFKLPSTPGSPEKTVLKGIKPFLNEDFILIHGTTVATNAFLENKMGKTAFLATKGFEDILRIGRQNRRDIFSLYPEKQPELVPENLCFPVEERTLFTGKISIKPNKTSIEKINDTLKKGGVESVAVVLLHSYANIKNETSVKSFLDPEFHITISGEIHPEPREYERAVITVLNSALQPVMSDYMNRLGDSLQGKKLYITRSDGGLTTPEYVKVEPVYTLLSGPAGGIVAAKTVQRRNFGKNLITLDMGGTSTDVSVIRNGCESISKNMKMNNLPVHIPMIDIKTIGAGGGSIASVDSAGVLRVGPESAGAVPGPACYGKSDIPTISDAFVVNGIIQPEHFLGGKMKLFPSKSISAIKKISNLIGKNLNKTADGIIEIAASSITGALRAVTVEKGEDPRNFALLPFGGAGGLIAGIVAEKLDIKKIIFPSLSGLFSAYGMLFSKLKKEFSYPILSSVEGSDSDKIDKIFSELKSSAVKHFKEELRRDSGLFYDYLLELKYRGQENSIRVEYNDDFLKNYHDKHKKLFSYSLDDSLVEIENIILIASLNIFDTKPEIRHENKKTKRQNRLLKEVFYKGEKGNFTFIKRNSISPDDKIVSPSVICSDSSTIVIDKKYDAYMDRNKNIIMERK